MNPEKHLMIRDVPEEERPRERLVQLGAEHCSNAELIAILLRTGTSSESVIALASRVLSKAGGIRGLTDTTLEELMEIRGIGRPKRCSSWPGSSWDGAFRGRCPRSG